MLAQPANRHLVTKIKASITAGIRPMSMIFHEQPTAAWESFDFLLLEAYQRLQDEMCPKCGHPVWLCRSSSPDVQFEVEETYCAGERALKEREAKLAGQKPEAKEKKAWGRSLYTVPVPLPGTELPSRMAYYEELAKSRGAVE